MIRLLCTTLAFLGIALGIVYYQVKSSPPVTNNTADAAEDRVELGGPFELVDQNAKACKSSDFKGKYMLVYFGYSYCPDACPLALQNMTKALASLQKDRDQIIPIFITLDPDRDGVEQMKTYSGNYDNNLFFLTGSKKAIDAVAKAYKTYAKKIENAETTEYLVDHSTLIYLMNREGKLVAYFPHSIDPQKLSQALVYTLSQEHKNKNVPS